MSTLHLVLFLSLTCLVLLKIWQRYKPNSQFSLPPQPPGDPLIGNIRQIIATSKQGQQHLLIQKWAREYGDIIRVKSGPVTDYYVSSDTAVKTLLDKSSAYTSERPRWIVSNEQMCNQWNVLLLNASDPRWKHQRKVIHSTMTSIPKADAGLPFLHHETAKFLYEASHDPHSGCKGQNTRLWKSIERYTYSTFASQTFGMDIPRADSHVTGYIHETGLAQILGTLPGFYIVDIMTWLDKLPLFLKPWERAARQRFNRDLRWACERLEYLKRELRGGISHNNLLANVITDDKHLGFESEEEAAYLCLQLILGAADTSQMSTWSFLEAMMSYPDVQAKARAHIDAVVGDDRLPVYSDLEMIPYVRCIMKEVWRWRPPVALGHPHVTTRDLTYNGYLIPAGSRLHVNAWAIGHDERRHHDPEKFVPERFADDHNTSTESMNKSNPAERDHFAFGAGRRVCSGIHVAERALAVAIMRILWAFEVAPEPGTILPLNPRDYPGPMPGNPGVKLPVTLRVRSEKKKKTIEEMYHQSCKDREVLPNLELDLNEK